MAPFARGETEKQAILIAIEKCANRNKGISNHLAKKDVAIRQMLSEIVIFQDGNKVTKCFAF